MPQPLSAANGPTDWNEAMDIISFGSPEQVDNYLFIFFLMIIFSSACRYSLLMIVCIQ